MCLKFVIGLDPRKIVTLLTGMWHPVVLEEEIRQQQKKIERRKETISKLKAGIPTTEQRLAEKRQQFQSVKKGKPTNILRNIDDIIEGDVLETELDDLESELGILHTSIEESNKDLERDFERLRKLMSIKL